MKWALVDSNNIVQNVIVYDGVSPYTPPDSLSAQQVNDWLNIGDDINEPQPRS